MSISEIHHSYLTLNEPPISIDPLLGRGPERKLSGVDPNDPSFELILDDEWVIPRGGEYFFSPSLKGLTETIALAA